jgi:hypothetical protein
MGLNEPDEKKPGEEQGQQGCLGPFLAASVGFVLGGSLVPIFFWTVGTMFGTASDSTVGIIFVTLGLATFGTALLLGALVDFAVSQSKAKRSITRQFRPLGLGIAGLAYVIGGFVGAGGALTFVWWELDLLK